VPEPGWKASGTGAGGAEAEGGSRGTPTPRSATDSEHRAALKVQQSWRRHHEARNPTSPIKRLYSSANVKAELSLGSAADSASLLALEKATFRDARWGNALLHLHSTGAWSDDRAVQSLIRKGAKAFGLWHLPEEALGALAKHLLKEEAITSPALEAWTKRLENGGENNQSKVLKSRQRAPTSMTMKGSMDKLASKRWLSVSEDGRIKLVLSAIVFLLSNLYALEVCCIMYPGVVGLFGWPIYVARAGGCGALLWTALLFLSMSRTFLRVAMRQVPIRSRWAHQIADCHKELHIFCGQMLLATSLVHGLAHCIGTVPGIESHTKEELNSLLGCANRESTPGYINAPMSWLSAPKCPLERHYTFQEVLFTSLPGISGLLLLGVICLVAYTGRQERRTKKFDIFWYVHSIAIPLWLLLLFLHGSNGWVGVGFPLVVPVCGLPVALYLVDRIGRFLRYYLFAGTKVRILDVVIRPGRRDVCNGALVHLSISRPPCLWSRHFRSGMYAFLCMPEYAPLQWHPFTICSGQDDATVDFIVAGLGDWTEELARRCWNAYEHGGELPKIAVDGPYLSPTTTALSREVLVAVGAGVGVTPLLSLMSTIIAVLERDSEDGRRALPLKEAHFFWMTRSADELLFGRKHFTKIVASPKLRDKVFLHLHVTHKAADKDVAAYLFREAVRRQSDVDRKAFRAATEGLPPSELIRGAQLPWCWVNNAKQDVLWVGSLIESSDAENEQAIAEAHTKQWAAGVSGTQIELASDGGKERGDTRSRFKQSKLRQSGLFSLAGSAVSLGSSAVTVNPAPSGLDAYLPVTFGRPDFAKEVRAIGQARPGHNVYVYVCGNDALVQSLRGVCRSCNDQAEVATARDGDLPQKYAVHYERFG